LKRLCAIALAAAGITVALPARAQTFGQFTSAEIIPTNGRLFGAYVVASENVASLLGHLRLSFYPGIDFGFQGGLSRQDFEAGDRTTLRLGTDLKIAVRQPSESLPVSIAVGGGLSVETGDDFSVLSVGPTAVVSRAFATSERTAISPYVGVGIAFSNIDVGPTSDTDVSVPVRVGAEFGVMPGMSLMAELQFQLGDAFSDDFGFSAGVNMPF